MSTIIWGPQKWVFNSLVILVQPVGYCMMMMILALIISEGMLLIIFRPAKKTLFLAWLANHVYNSLFLGTEPGWKDKWAERANPDYLRLQPCALQLFQQQDPASARKFAYSIQSPQCQRDGVRTCREKRALGSDHSWTTPVSGGQPPPFDNLASPCSYLYDNQAWAWEGSSLLVVEESVQCNSIKLNGLSLKLETQITDKSVWHNFWGQIKCLAFERSQIGGRGILNNGGAIGLGILLRAGRPAREYESKMPTKSACPCIQERQHQIPLKQFRTQ